MLTAKLVRLDTAWSATPQPSERTAWPHSRRTVTAQDGRGAADSAARPWAPASAAMPATRSNDGHAEHPQPSSPLGGPPAPDSYQSRDARPLIQLGACCDAGS